MKKIGLLRAAELATDRVFDARSPLDVLDRRHRALSIARNLDDARRRAAFARPAADDQALARALRAPEQVGEGPGVADVAAVAQNYPPRCYAVAAQALSLFSSKILINYP